MSEIFDAAVRNLSSDGHGVVPHPSGKVFFVRGVWPGDRGRFRVTQAGRRYGLAKLEELLAPSADRVEKIPCPYQGVELGQCGGCPWMQGDYSSQLRHKEERLRHALGRALATRNLSVVKGIWPSPAQWAYRNRAQFKTNGKVIGFVSGASHSIVPIDECMVLEPKLQHELGRLRASLPNEKWKPARGSSWNFIDVDTEFPTAPPNERLPFRQGNQAQNERMKAWLREHAQNLGAVLELYCGSGNFTRVFLDGGVRQITAVEVSELALQNLPKDSRLRADVRALGSYKAWTELAEDNQDAELLFLDPPREGASGVEKLVQNLPRLAEIDYVACDVSTWVRDIVRLLPLGFRLEEVQPLDLFPHTPHVEILSRLRRSAHSKA